MTAAPSSETAITREEREPRPRARVVVVGNPNVGKTTLYNALAKQDAPVGNYPGITVERHVGRLGGDGRGSAIELVDVPGTYSLSARSAEEQIAIASAIGLFGEERPDLAVVVVDAGQLVRNLYLVLQLVELDVPCVVALNMIDEVADNPPRPAAIAELFSVPCVATSGRSGAGLDLLAETIRRAVDSPPHGRVEIRYGSALRADVDRVAEALPPGAAGSVERARALARWALLSVDDADELHGVDERLRARVREVRAAAAGRDLDLEIVGARYAFLDAHAAALFARGAETPPRRPWNERLDRILIHPVWGFAAFVATMTLLFQALFTWADPPIRAIEWIVASASSFLESHLPPSFVRDLLVSGILGGVGNVVVFVPQIVLLFFFVGLLEDSGYMARVAYLMDRVMRALGLHGRAFVPMLSGFACAIPAILATRTMERKRDRILTMLVIPLMTCSARLPVYTLIIAALFPPRRVFGIVPLQGLLMVSMYLFATLTALVAAGVLGRVAVRGRRVPLILELPPYRLPQLAPTLRMMWRRARSFLTDAGTTILACTVVLWVLLSYPKPSHVDPGTPPAAVAEQTIRGSYAGRVGRAIEPAIAPLGFDWKIGVGLVGAFAAREVFVSTMGLVYGEGGSADDPAPLRERLRHDASKGGAAAYSPLTGLSLLVFFAIACQCVSTLVTVHRETRTWRWPLLLFAYTGVLAWTTSFVVYQGGKLLGF